MNWENMTRQDEQRILDNARDLIADPRDPDQIVRDPAEDLRQLVKEATGNVPSWALTRGIRALTALETELSSANADADRLATLCENQGREMISRQGIIDALHAELATAKADLERAREEERERIIAVLQKEGGAFFRGRTGRWGEGYIEAADLRGLLTRAALAPEQKG